MTDLAEGDLVTWTKKPDKGTGTIDVMGSTFATVTWYHAIYNMEKLLLPISELEKVNG